jgi:hypothetical protein
MKVRFAQNAGNVTSSYVTSGHEVGLNTVELISCIRVACDLPYDCRDKNDLMNSFLFISVSVLLSSSRNKISLSSH